MLTIRASGLLIGAVCGALRYHSPTAVLIGLVLGHIVALSCSSSMDRSLLFWRPGKTKGSELVDFSRYGMLAAAASVIHLSVPVVIRFIVLGGLDRQSINGASFSMALDLMQRPFTVLVSAIDRVTYPDVVRCYENGTEERTKKATAHLFELFICSTAIMMGGMFAFLEDAAFLFIPQMLLGSFLASAPGAIAFYFLHTHLQATLAVVPHLRKTAFRLVIVATCQLIVVFFLVSLIREFGGSPSMMLIGATVGTGIVLIFACGPTVRFGAIPNWSLIFFSLSGGIIMGTLVLLPQNSVLWLPVKLIVAGVISLVVAYLGIQGNRVKNLIRQ